jgi:hypothetical protein
MSSPFLYTICGRCTSKAFRSPLLALCSSTINEASEYIIIKVPLFSVVGSLLGHSRIHSTAKEIAKCGTPHGWYPPSPSEFASCWLVGMRLISLALKPVPVEEQPVASTTITLRMTIRNADRLISFTKAPEQRSVKKTTTA